MKVDKKKSWKEKIGPAFDDLIKVHLDYINHTHICSSNRDKRYKKYKRFKKYLSLDDESLKALERRGYPPLLKEFRPNPNNLEEKVPGFSLGQDHKAPLTELSFGVAKKKMPLDTLRVAR